MVRFASTFHVRELAMKLAVMMSAAFSLAGTCQVRQDPGEVNHRPTITFIDNRGAPITSISYPITQTAPSPFLCIAKDPGGVQSISLRFGMGETVGCCYSTGLQQCGGFGLVPPLASQDAQGPPAAPGGTAQPSLTVGFTLQGPYACDLHTAGVAWLPATVAVTCTASNYAPGGINTVTIPITFSGVQTAPGG